MTPRIRLAGPDDAAAVQSIYAPVVTSTAISLEVDPPTIEEMAARIDGTLPDYPWLVATEHGRTVGYAYASRVFSRAAYRWAVEISFYIAEGSRGRGLGRALMLPLIALLEAQGHCRVLAAITLPNPASVRLHESAGFRPVGVMRRIGWKQGAWHDVGWWQRDLVPEGVPAPPIRRVDELAVDFVARTLDGSP
jgi:L-amino acid N-acyltransferase YncA